MGWSSNEENTKKGMDLSSKIVIAIIACLSLIIVLIVLMLFVQINMYILKIDNVQAENYDINKLVAKVDNVTYINIEEFSKLVGYEYHKGEFKAYTNEDNKCYVQGKEETTSFFLNDNKIYKLPIDEFDSDYSEISIDNPIIEISGEMYATIETVNTAFNVVVNENDKEMNIYTLSYLIKSYDKNVKNWGYTGISDLDFENQKALLYNCLIVKKKDGLYKIINNSNTEEIVPDRYNSIQFSESTKEFFVTNSAKQVGIINLDGTTKIDPIYDSIEVLDKKANLYLVEKNKKYGVVKSGNTIIISPEYDKIGLENKQHLILDTLIPICKNDKWGAFDKTGKLVYNIQYDGFGCDLTTVEVGGIKKNVNPVLSIEKCNGIVVKNNEKYGILDLEGKELIPIAVSNIYEIEGIEDKDSNYFMLYNGTELNIIERLIVAGIIKEENKEEQTQDTNTIENSTITNNNININTNTIITNNYNSNSENLSFNVNSTN